MGMKFRVVCRKLYDYVRYDLKEIAFPSSLPDPPHIKKRPKLTWKDKWCILKEASRLYGASWDRDIGPDLRPNDYNKAKEEPDINTEEGKSEPTTVEDVLGALRGGAEKAKPVLRRMYMDRASNYTDALKNYVESYKEGLKEHLEEEALGRDLLEKLWGWDMLIPFDYSNLSYKPLYLSYLDKFFSHSNATYAHPDSVALQCLKNEEALMSEWKRVRSYNSSNAECIAKEAALMIGWLRYQSRIPCHVYLASSRIRHVALQLATFEGEGSTHIGAVLLAMAKEAELLLEIVKLNRLEGNTDDLGGKRLQEQQLEDSGENKLQKKRRLEDET
uniref:Uncharacterized protein n=1 Tax=Leersia perrieri TaxID=77586 RepID=A0A0D9WBV9_9ORYZ